MQYTDDLSNELFHNMLMNERSYHIHTDKRFDRM